MIATFVGSLVLFEFSALLLTGFNAVPQSFPQNAAQHMSIPVARHTSLTEQPGVTKTRIVLAWLCFVTVHLPNAQRWLR